MSKHDDILNRMYNWKFRSAYNYAKEGNGVGIPKEAQRKLKFLAEQFENCGHCDGKAFDNIWDLSDEVADLLGYKWEDKKDYWVEK